MAKKKKSWRDLSTKQKAMMMAGSRSMRRSSDDRQMNCRTMRIAIPTVTITSSAT